jgi:arylsulfatase A-like enzyme
MRIPCVLSMFLVCFCAIRCTKQVHTDPGSIVRLYPTGKFLPLFECSRDEFDNLKSRSSDRVLSEFYRIDCNRQSHPGKIIPAGKSWMVKKNIRSPGKLSFSAFAIAPGPHKVSLHIMVAQADGEKLEKTVTLRARSAFHARWELFEINLEGMHPGPVNIEMMCTRTVEGEHAETAWLFIGAPMIFPENPANDYPNIVLVVPDTLRADYLGCYGMPERLSPVLDNLSRHADLFVSALATSSWTRPTVNTIFTGLYPFRNKQFRAPFSHFQCDYKLLTDQLAEMGFNTLGVSSSDLITPISEYDRGFDTFNSQPCSHALTNSTLQILKTVRKILPAPDESPFFLYVHCMDPHDAYVAPPPFNRMFFDHRETIRLRQTIQAGLATITMNDINDGLAPPLQQQEVDYLISQYKGEIYYMDRMLGRMIRELKVRYPDDEFIFIVMSDHGEAFMEHGTLSHGNDVYQETIHVPWIVSRFDQEGEPELIPQHVSQVDLYSSILGLLNRKPVIQTDGLNMFSSDLDDSRVFFSMLTDQPHTIPYWRAAICRDRKLIQLEGEPRQEFNLATDPAELNPLDLEGRVQDHLSSELDIMIRNEMKFSSHYRDRDKVMENLKALGYVR